MYSPNALSLKLNLMSCLYTHLYGKNKDFCRMNKKIYQKMVCNKNTIKICILTLFIPIFKPNFFAVFLRMILVNRNLELKKKSKNFILNAILVVVQMFGFS